MCPTACVIVALVFQLLLLPKERAPPFTRDTGALHGHLPTVDEGDIQGRVLSIVPTGQEDIRRAELAVRAVGITTYFMNGWLASVRITARPS